MPRTSPKPPEGANIFFQATPRQDEFIRAVLSGQYRYLLYGGAIRGGKSYVCLFLAMLMARIYPGSRWAIVRKDLPRIKNNVIPTWLKLQPANGFFGEIHRTDWKIRAKNGSEILLWPENYEQDKDLDRWKGLEVNGFFFEEVNECQEVSFLKAIERAGAWVIPGQRRAQPPPMIICTCNPSDGWVKTRWYDPWKAGQLKSPYYYLPAYITDNPHLPDAYVQSLKSLPEQEYKRFVEGDWSLTEIPDQLICSPWVLSAYERQPSALALTGQHRLGVDVARYGDDRTVLVDLRGSYLANILTWKGKSLTETAKLVGEYIREHGIKPYNVRVDVVGVGAGVADDLRERQGLAVSSYIGGGKAVWEHKHFRFKNARSEAYWYLREGLDPEAAPDREPGTPGIGKVGAWSLCINPNLADTEVGSTLMSDLTCLRYRINNDKQMSLETKEEVKARLGRSPDIADALAMACSPGIGAVGYLAQINKR